MLKDRFCRQPWQWGDNIVYIRDSGPSRNIERENRSADFLMLLVRLPYGIITSVSSVWRKKCRWGGALENYGWKIYDQARMRPGGRLDSDGNLIIRINARPGRYRFVFELGGGTFDPSVMFLKVNGVPVGPTARFWRVPGFEHAGPKTRHLPSRQMVCPIIEIYLDHAWQGSAITEFPSHAEVKRGYYLGEFALELPSGAHELKLVNGRGYRMEFLRVHQRRDERAPFRPVRMRQGLAGRHPRLYFTTKGLPELRARRAGAARARFELFERHSIRERLKRIAAGEAPDSLDVMPMSFMFLLTGRRRYFAIARQAFMAMLASELPGPEEGRMEVNGAEPGHLLEYAAVFYDWCHAALDESERMLIRASAARVLHWWLNYIKFNSLEWPGNAGGMEHSAYNYHGLGLAGLAFLGEIPEAQEAADWAARHFELAARRMTPDGALGLLPKEHCLSAFFNYAMAFRHAVGKNILACWPFFKIFADCRIRKETADCQMFPTYYRPDYEPDFIAWEAYASLAGNQDAQWLAERYFQKARAKSGMAMKSDRLRNCSRSNALWRFLFYDWRIPARPDFSRRNPDRHLAGAGLVLFRTGWWESDTVHVMLNAAHAHGEKLYAEEHRVAYAMPPHANSVGVFGFGQTIAAPVGNTYRQASDLGNTLTIEEQGQIGDGSVFGVCQKWSSTGKIIAVRPGARVAYAAGEAAQCYAPEIGLRRFARHVVFYKPDIVLIVDDVELFRPRGAEIHFAFPIIEPTAYAGKIHRNQLRMAGAGQAEFLGRTARMRLCVPAGMGLKLEQSACRLARNYTDADSEFERLTIRSAPARRHVFVTLLLMAPADFRPAGKSLVPAAASRWAVNWRGRRLDIDAELGVK